MISRNGHENSKKVKGVSAKTLNTEVQLIKGILKYAVEREWLAREPNLTKVAPVIGLISKVTVIPAKHLLHFLGQLVKIRIGSCYNNPGFHFLLIDNANDYHV